MSSYLLEDLGIAGFMLRPSCDRKSANYNPRNIYGWNSGYYIMKLDIARAFRARTFFLMN